MNLVTRDLPNTNYLWWIYGTGATDWFWSRFQAGGGFYESQWLTVSHRPVVAASETAIIDLSGHNPYVDPRDADRVTFNLDGQHVVLPRGVEYFDSSLNTTTEIRWIEHFGATTDGSLNKLHADVGNHEFNFTTSIKDSSLHLGAGWDTVNLIDHRDIPGTQYWALIRRDDNSLDAYSLLTGRRVRMEDGLESRNGLAGKHNFGEVEVLTLDDSRNGGQRVQKPGVDVPTGRENFTNIDLRSDGATHTDSFNLAYFNFIRYTSDNVWVGQSTVHNGTIYSTPSDRTVDADKSIYLKSGYNHDAPVISGQLSVIGQSRNGTHDLIVTEQATAIDGKLRVYTFNVQSGLYNEFNHVFLGTSVGESVSKSTITTSNWSDRVALYGFGGNDVLVGGAGRDYLFGGQSVYNQLLGSSGVGNQVTGGTGADYFGVGNTNVLGAVTGPNAIVAVGKGDFHQGYATDVIMDWRAQSAVTPHDQADTLVVLSNGVAVIGGLRDGNGVVSLSQANLIDLRDYAAIATSDQDFDGARGGDNWDASQSLDYIFANQATRDSHSIRNEGDRTVVNEGLIVARGLDGADTIYGSTGDDYLYGNKASNIIHIGNTGDDGNDRIYYDTFDGSAAKHFITGFTVSNGGVNATDADKFFVNKRVIDAFYSAGSNRALTTFDSNGEYEKAQAYNARVNFMHDAFYNPSYASNNATHTSEDGRAPSVIQGADGTTFGIGAGMVATGFAMLFVPFVGAAIAKALFATGAVLGAATMVGSSVIPTDPHKNATFSGNVDGYLNVLTDNSTNTGNGVLLRPNTSGDTSIDTSVRFLDFFQGADAGDGYLPVVEFTARSGPIFSYFALHSSDHTFVYLVASRDNMVENAEAILVAQIEGRLKAEDFGVYDGQEDIYNFNAGGEPQVVFVDPTIAAVRDSNTDLNPDFDYGYTPGANGTNASDGLIVAPADAVKAKIVIEGTVAQAVSSSTHYFRVFDGSRKIYDGNDNTFTNLATLTLTGGTSFTIVDNRSLGTSARQTDTEVVNSQTVTRSTTLDNDFILTDSRVSYTVELIDRTTGIPTRDSAKVVTVKGGVSTIDGGSGNDTLTITETSEFLNNATNNQLVNIESILITPSGSSAVNVNLSNQQEGFIITASSNGDTIVGGQGTNTFNGGLGNDAITGFAGNDTFNGFLGNDTLIGGGGIDLLRVFGTSASLNVASDAQLQTIETVHLIIDERQPQFSVSVNGSGVVTEVRVVDPGAGLVNGTYTNVAITGTNGVAANVSFTIAQGSIQIPTNTVAPTTDTDLPLGSPLPLAFTAVGSGHSASDTYALVNVIATAALGGEVYLGSQSEGYQLIGSQHADTLTGGAGNNTITGGAGNDRLVGGVGNDIFIIEAAAHHGVGETITGGSGVDTIRFTSTTANETLTLSQHVTDTDNVLNVTIGNAQGITTGTTALNVTAAAIQGSLAVNLVGNDGANALTGTGNADTINGGAGNDTIVGGGGADTLNGGTGNDSIVGEDGNDVIDGGAGADTLTGGSGSDTFKVSAFGDSTFASMDVITDFAFGASGDALDLSAVDGVGKVGYTTKTFTSLTELTAYVKSTFTYIVSGEKQVVLGAVVNPTTPSEDGVYAFSHAIDAVYWQPNDANSSIVKLSGVASVTGISGANFIGEQSVGEILSLTDIANVSITSSLASPMVGPVLVGAEDTVGSAEYISDVVYIDPSITNVDTKVVASFIHTTVSSQPGKDQFATEQGIVVVPSVFTLQTTQSTSTSFSMQNWDMQVLLVSEVANVINFATVASGWQGARSFFYFDGTADRNTARNDDYAALWFWKDTGDGVAQTSELRLVAQYNNAGFNLKDKIFFTPASTAVTFTPPFAVTATGIQVDLLSSGAVLAFNDGSQNIATVTATGSGTTTLALTSAAFNKVGYFAVDGSALEPGAYYITGSDGSESIDVTSRLASASGNGSASKAYTSALGGNDSIVGWSGVDVIFAGNGDNTIVGGAAIDSLYGGEDNDTFVYDSSVADQTGGAGEVISGGNGFDRIVVAGGSFGINFSDDDISGIETLELTENAAGSSDGFDQSLTMTAAQVDGFATINANDGTTSGSSDKITIVDIMTAGMLDGTAINGTLELILTEQFSGADVHQLVLKNTSLQSGSDLLKINASNLNDDDRISVDASALVNGYVSVTGGIGNDTIIGGAGNDILEGGFGVDSLLGGSGETTFVYNTADVDATLGGVETIDGGGGTNTLLVAGGTNSVDFSTDSITNIGTLELTQNAAGSADGNAQSLVMTNSQIDGFHTINANVGDNITVSNTMQASMLNGTVINGTLEIKLTDQNTTTVVAQALTVLDSTLGHSSYILKVNASALTSDTLNFNGSAEGGAAFSITGGAGNDSLTGGAGNDTINGGHGNDYLVGGAGDDLIVGGEGNDVIEAGAGSNTVTGGDGVDTFRVFVGDGVTSLFVTDVGVGGADRVQLNNNTDASVVVTLGAAWSSDADTFNRTSAHSKFKILTNSFDVNMSNANISGTNSGFLIDSTVGAGTNIVGSGKSDEVIGSSFVDTINGGAGDDTISGGGGGDLLSGGLGGDIFVFSSSSDSAASVAANATRTFDAISDFESGVDKIRIDSVGAIDAAMSATANVTVAAFSDVATFADLVSALASLNASSGNTVNVYDLTLTGTGLAAGGFTRLLIVNDDDQSLDSDDLMIHLSGTSSASILSSDFQFI